MAAYYNEVDPQAAQWLRNLITAGLIPAGDVDERSVEDVIPNEIRGYTQCHFFAGIAGWPLALDLAGWPRNRPVWTGSCPCQPFSAAGKGDGFTDERHLWPAWFHLIRECRPVVVFGEQVATAIRHNWLDLVSADMEAQGYAIGAAVLGAHSVGAPHIRQRLYWMAYDTSTGLERPPWTSEQQRMAGSFGSSKTGSVPNTLCSGQSRPRRVVRSSDPKANTDRQISGTVHAGREYWSRAEPVPCADGKARLLEPGIEPLAHGIPARMVRLRSYGNAICPQTAAAFIEAAYPLL